MRGRICGTGSYIPEHYYDNNDLAKFVETNDEWIRERTGIVRRHIAEEDTTVSMAIKAAKNALTDAKLNADDLDLILETCRRVLLIADGALAADGPAQELLRDKALLEANGLELPLCLAGVPEF